MSRPVSAFAVAGIRYRVADYYKANVRTGDVVSLHWELTNQHDPWATAVLKNGIKIGYVPREETWKYHRFRELGIKLLCKVEMCDEASCRVQVSAESDPKQAPNDYDCLDG